MDAQKPHNVGQLETLDGTPTAREPAPKPTATPNDRAEPPKSPATVASKPPMEFIDFDDNLSVW